MAKNDLFWVAPGVVSVDGKEYGVNDALPVDKIDKKKLARWKKEGKVGAKIAPVANTDKVLLENANKKISELQDEVADLSKQLKDSGSDDEKIKGLEDKIDKLESDVKEKAALIEKLEEAAKEAATK
jgi:predicted RNase H-like nuclease (RuvC/YqgF family)